jgi:DNA-binding NarL/FixJ family response regulator
MLLRSINLAIVDGHSLFRKTLKSFLSEHEKISVVIQGADMCDLIKKMKVTPVDVLLIDIFTPGLNGTDELRFILEEFPDVKIVALSMTIDIESISDLLEAGIHGYVSKADEPEELLKAIRSAVDNRIYCSTLYIRNYTGGAQITLNERERKILQLIWEEKSTREIADELFLGTRSVEKIRQDIKDKIGARSIVGLLKYGIHKKIIHFAKTI